jgi:predicted RNA-binding Zn-ribbon protein involved in translation (DUF1610 family)
VKNKKMGFWKENAQKLKADLAKNMAEARRQSSFICPKCGGTMGIVWTASALAFADKVRCIECGYMITLGEAKRTLQHL